MRVFFFFADHCRKGVRWSSFFLQQFEYKKDFWSFLKKKFSSFFSPIFYCKGSLKNRDLLNKAMIKENNIFWLSDQDTTDAYEQDCLALITSKFLHYNFPYTKLYVQGIESEYIYCPWADWDIGFSTRLYKIGNAFNFINYYFAKVLLQMLWANQAF